jgi:hypothetical protein
MVCKTEAFVSVFDFAENNIPQGGLLTMWSAFRIVNVRKQ